MQRTHHGRATPDLAPADAILRGKPPSPPRCSGRRTIMPAGHHPVAVLVGGDAPTRAMLRFLLKDDGCEVIEVAHVGAMASVPADVDVAVLVLVDGERED